MLRNYGKGILLLGRAQGVRSCRAVAADIVQPSKLPDGLLEVTFEGQKKPDHVLIEVATYPERRAVKQAMDDLTLATAALGRAPDVLVLVLHPKGRYRIPTRHEVKGRLGWSRLLGEWKVVELWDLDAEELLAGGDVGVVPWVPLARYEGEPAALLERCRERIEAQAQAKDRADLLAVSQVFARLKFPDPNLLALLGGERVMIESPLIQELVADRRRKDILEFLQERFGSVPREIPTLLESVTKEKRLTELVRLAARCPDLKAFRERLLS